MSVTTITLIQNPLHKFSRHLTTLLGLALLTALVVIPATAGSVYVYEHTDSSKLITNKRKTSPALKLIKSYHYKSTGSSVPRILTPRPSEYDSLIKNTAKLHGVDGNLVKAIIHVESSFSPNAQSHKGAYGLMQLMPATAIRYGVKDVADPQDNLSGGIRYLKDMLKRFGQDTRLALAAYNAGENAVARYNGVPPYHETVDYVAKVMRLHSLYAR